MQNNLLHSIKKILKNSFQEISKDFIKNNLELIISIYFHLRKVIYTNY